MDSSESSSLRRSIGFVLGIVLFTAVWAGPVPEGLSPAAAKTGAIGLLMAAWWITEAIPIAATALVPLVLFPLLGVSDMSAAASPYANPLIFLFMGGFMIAQAMQTWNLHRRIALGIVRWVGVRPASIVIGFILASAFLSMWVSNTATALMMLPIGLSIIDLTADRLEADITSAAPHFGLVLVLSIAYACNVGGIATLIGTPPNALLAGFMSESYGVEVGFAEWMMIGLPVALCLLPFVYLALTWIYPIELETLPGGADLIDQEIAELGDVSRAERRVGIVFVLTALLWITRPLLTDFIPALSDAGIAMGAALVLFVIPSGTENRALLSWPDAEDLPWGVLILFGGGLSLAAQISDTGLAEWVGGGVSALSGWPVLGLLLATVALIVVLTEITSNTATTAAFLPILGAVAIGVGENPFLLAVPAALGASCAFMLPVATPPNAIIYGSGLLSIPQMSRVGAWLNLLSIVLVSCLAYVLLGLAFGVEIGTLPPWAGG